MILNDYFKIVFHCTPNPGHNSDQDMTASMYSTTFPNDSFNFLPDAFSQIYVSIIGDRFLLRPYERIQSIILHFTLSIIMYNIFYKYIRNK